MTTNEQETVSLDQLGYASTQKPKRNRHKNNESRKTPSRKTTGDQHMQNTQVQDAAPVPSAGGQTSTWKAKARGIGSIALEAGASHALKPVVHGFFYALGAGLAYKGAKKVGLI